MAVERRVKPSARMKAELSARRKPILVGCLAVLLAAAAIAATIFVPPYVGELLGKGSSDPNSTKGDNSAEAVKALLTTTVDYEGNWVSDGFNRFQVYLPGETRSTAEGLASTAVYVNSGGTVAYGVLVGDNALPTLEGDPTRDPNALLSVLMPQLTSDVGAALYGAKFSGSYDVTTMTLGDKTPGLWVSGDLQTVMGLRSEGSSEVTQVTYNFPLYGFIMIRDDYPVFVWGAADPDDGSASATLANYMQQCANILLPGEKESNLVTPEE